MGKAKKTPLEESVLQAIAELESVTDQIRLKLHLAALRKKNMWLPIRRSHGHRRHRAAATSTSTSSGPTIARAWSRTCSRERRRRPRSCACAASPKDSCGRYEELCSLGAPTGHGPQRAK
jgi:hypothetical protein